MTFEEQRYQGGRIEGFLVSIVVHFEIVFLPLAGFAYLSQLSPLLLCFVKEENFPSRIMNLGYEFQPTHISRTRSVAVVTW